MKRIGVAFFIAAVVVVGGCESKPKNSDTDSKANWAGKMQGLAVEVQELIPFLYSRQEFFNPQNANKIRAGLKKFAQQSHNITPQMGQSYFGSDPMAAYSLKSLQGDLSRAEEAFSMGQTEYARGVAKAATTHCFRCHSLIKEGNQASWDVTQFNNVSLKPLERVDLLVAARRYEEAFKFMEPLLTDTSYVQNYPFDFEAALRKYLSLMIRMENGPQRPLKELDRILKMKGIPYYVAEQARAWKSSLMEWSKDNQSKGKKDLLKEARARIAKAAEVQQFAKDHAGDIEYLRATTLLHEYLRTASDTAKMADAYFLLGQAYEVLDELGDWNLHEVYYESCIKKAPRTQLSKRCYGRLEASIFMGFSGSSGVHIPASERDRLVKLKELTL